MVKQHNNRKEQYQCEACRMHYAAKEFAQKCEDWCSKHKGTKDAILTSSSMP